MNSKDTQKDALAEFSELIRKINSGEYVPENAVTNEQILAWQAKAIQFSLPVD